MTQRLRYAAKSDVGLLREGNEDSAYAGPRLLAVADGMGGHAHGEVASAGAIATLAPLDNEVPHDFPDTLVDAVRQANEELRRMMEADPSLEGMGTTLTAILWEGERSALVHIGDSRAYMLRDGQLYRITRDHTLVQSLIDEGRIDEDEAAMHPQRSLLLRALDGHTQVEPDFSVHDTRTGDRYLLCSDGLSGVVSEDTLRETLSAGWDPDRVVAQLIELANRGGGPDNITCVVADVVEARDATEGPSLVAGAAANTVQTSHNNDDTISLDTSAGRAAALTRPQDDSDEEVASEAPGRSRRRWPHIFLSLLVVVATVGGASYSAWNYVRSQFYVGSREGEVVIFRGISQHVAGKRLSRVYSRTGLALTELPKIQRSAVASNIQAESLQGAEEIVDRLRAHSCVAARQGGEQDRAKEGESAKPNGRQQNKQEDAKAGQSARDGDGTVRNKTVKSTSSPTGASSPDSSSANSAAQACPEGVSAADG